MANAAVKYLNDKCNRAIKIVGFERDKTQLLKSKVTSAMKCSISYADVYIESAI